MEVDKLDGPLDDESEKIRQLKEKLANEEYKIWKKQSPFIYDVCLTKALNSISPTIQWFPDRPPYSGQENDDSYFKTYSLLLGTAASSTGVDYVYKGLVDLPGSSYDGKEPLLNLIAEGQRIVHEGEVNRARYSPLNPDIVATMADSGDVYIFDTSTYSTDSVDGSFEPTLILKHHTEQGYGLVWSPHDATKLATGTKDGTVAFWDIKEALGGPRKAQVSPEFVLNIGPATVNDLSWSPHFNYLVAIASEDHLLRIFDTRSNRVVRTLTESASAINSVDFNPLNPDLLATAAADGSIAVYDLRVGTNGKRIIDIKAHTEDASYVKWSPHDESVLASGGYDRRILIWDFSLQDTVQTAEEQQEGPPELLFVHGGHLARINEFDWHPTLPWTIASISEDVIAQVWRVAGSIVDRPIEEDEEEDEDAAAPPDGDE